MLVKYRIIQHLLCRFITETDSDVLPCCMLLRPDSEGFMESERKWSAEVLRGEQQEEEGDEDVMSEGLEELDFSIIDDDEVDEEEHGSTPPFDGCCKGMTEASARWS